MAPRVEQVSAVGSPVSQTTSPPPLENFETPPVVVGDPYGYGEPGSMHLGPQPLGAEGDGD